MWTAHALARAGWCYAKVGRLEQALALCEDAVDIVEHVKPGDESVIRGSGNHWLMRATSDRP